MATRKTHKSSGSRNTNASKARSSVSKAKPEAAKAASKAATTSKATSAKKPSTAKANDTKESRAKSTPAKAAQTKTAQAKAEPKATAAKAKKAETKAAATKATTSKTAAKTAVKKPAAKTAPKASDTTKPAATEAKKPVATAKPSPKAAPAKPVAPRPSTTPEPTKAPTKAEPAKQDATSVAAKPAAEPKPAPKPAAAAKKAEPQPKESSAPVKEEKPTPKPAETAKPEAAPKPVSKPESKPAPKAERPVEAKKAEDEAQSKPAEGKPAPVEAPTPKEETMTEETPAPAEEPQAPAEPPLPEPRRSVAFIGSECYPFVKTGGLGDVMYALPKALIPQNCDVKVILPKYACIKQEYKDKMVYRGSFDMDLCSDGTKYYVGIMEYVSDDGVVYDFIDNEWFFNSGNPYTNLVDDIPKYCYFAKAALAALNYLNWTPDIVHCHDWQASLVPIYLKTMFQNTPLGHAKSILTIHNLRFQGKYDIRTVEYWSGLPSYVFNEGAIQENWTDGNMLKGGLAYADMITTVSGTYAAEIQTPEYGEGLDAHLRYHSGKLRGIVNGIDYGIWNPAEDKLIEAPYSSQDVLDKKKQDKLALQKELGLEEDGDKMVIGLISRLTNQKGLDLVNDIFQQLLDGNTQVVILGTGEPQYEDSFRWYENNNKGTVCSNIMYDEARSHQIYAGADALLVPSRFEPCGLTQLIAMHYGTIPVVRETGGLKDTVQPYNQYTDEGNGFTFDRYESGLLLDAINRAKTLYFTDRDRWDEMVVRDMEKDVSWDNSAKQYRQLYVDLTS